MKYLTYSALAALSLATATTAGAQGIEFNGVRAEAHAGIDRFYSEGRNDNHFGYGGAVGLDFRAGNLVFGPEGTFWNARGENIGRDGPGVAARKSFEEWGVGARAGVLISESTLLYGKAMFVVNEQRKRFDADPVATPGIPVNTAFGDYYNHYRTKGWQVGGGVEQMVGDMFFVKAEGRYSNYRTNSSRLTGLLGVGVRFGAAAPVEVLPPPPPPPPVVAPPPPPQTQTCPDGSVILVTDSCPLPPAPPPPPPPEPVRG